MVLSLDRLTSVIASLLRKYNAQKAILFGSYARREADEHSDIDLLVIGGASFRPTDIFALAEELHLNTGKAVDVYELREVDQNSAFYHTILREGLSVAA